MAAREKTSKERSWSRQPGNGDRDRHRPTGQRDIPVSSRRSSTSTSETGRQRNAPGTNLTRPAASSSPFGVMHQLSDEMSRLFSSFGFGRELGRFGFEQPMWAPQVDVLRRGDELVVRADLPGLEKEDITVDVTDNLLTIRGERREETEEEREGYYWHERSAGSFLRSIPLPEGAQVEQADARFENGVLEVTLPAPERETSRGRRIDIR